MSRFFKAGERSTLEKLNLKILLLKSIVVRTVLSFPNKNDASPENLFFESTNAVILALPKELGIGPDKLLDERSMFRAGFLNEPKLSGIEPVSWF